MENTIRQWFEQNLKIISDEATKDNGPDDPIVVDPEKENLYMALAAMSDELFKIREELAEVRKIVTARD